MMDPIYSMAFTAGLLGSGHCIGMCGGMVAALSLAGPEGQSGRKFQLGYHLGRMLTYTALGFGVGWLGSAFALTDSFRLAARGILLFSDLLIILLGLGSSLNWSRFNLMRLEFDSAVPFLAGAAKRFRQWKSSVGSVLLGTVMGLLPCGYLYAMAITAAQTASPAAGALTLLCFGAGTVPSLLIFAEGAVWLTRGRRILMLRLAGFLVALMGAWNLFRHLGMMGLLH